MFFSKMVHSSDCAVTTRKGEKKKTNKSDEFIIGIIDVTVFGAIQIIMMSSNNRVGSTKLISRTFLNSDFDAFGSKNVLF